MKNAQLKCISEYSLKGLGYKYAKKYLSVILLFRNFNLFQVYVDSFIYKRYN